MVYRLTLSYRGTSYSGWQRQNHAVSVQQKVEEAVAELVGQDLRLVAASRTDAGVHARGQVVHFELDRDFPESGFVHGTNRHLPEDIRVMSAHRMAKGFHARKCAKSKEYRYTLMRARVLSPLDAQFAVGISSAIDFEAMRKAAATLVGRHDFTAFALAGGSHSNPYREILVADWQEEDKRLVFRIVGSGFLRGMVRGIVGSLLDVGRGRMTPDGFQRLLGGLPRSEAGPTAPARGLVLERVTYPPEWKVQGESGRDP